MRKTMTVALALLGAAIMPTSPANAESPHGLGHLAKSAHEHGAVIKVHSARQVHDKLHAYGYHRVVYQSQYYDDYGKPVYQFRACQGPRAFSLNVNWYGDIIGQHPAGRCHYAGGYGGYNDYNYRRRRDW